jgi:HAD superfamily hydrolase (TIGR01509 family)
MKKAVIFDMDGVIADTQVLHAATESRLLQEHGIDLDPHEITRRYAGTPDKLFFVKVFKDAEKLLESAERLIEEKWRRMFSSGDEHIRPMAGVLELIRGLHDRGISMAVASASRKDFIEKVVTVLGVKDYFSALVSSDEVEHGKPAPDIFLRAAELIGAAPEDCVVIEDGLAGMQAAKAANMKCVALLTHVPAEESPSEIKVNSFYELSVDELLE